MINIKKTHPYALLEVLKSTLPDGFLDWDPDVILLSLIKRGWNLEDPEAKDKLLAVQGCAFNPQIILNSYADFENVAQAFNNNPMLVDVTQEMDIPELHYAVYNMLEIWKTIGITDIEFSQSVQTYIAACAFSTNEIILPPLLSFAQEALDFYNRSKFSNPEFKSTLESLKAIIAEHIEIEKITQKELDALESYPEFKSVIASMVYDPTIIE